MKRFAPAVGALFGAWLVGGSDTDAGSGDAAEGDGGCGCRSGGATTFAAWLPLLIALRRRRP